MMPVEDELMTLERGFWDAINDPDYYREHMADEGLAVFSIGVMGKDAAIASTSGQDMATWTDVALSNVRVLEVGDDAAALVYKGSAKRDGQPYSANASSVYVRRNGLWQLILHQQSEAA
jgi:hypothetical protein